MASLAGLGRSKSGASHSHHHGDKESVVAMVLHTLHIHRLRPSLDDWSYGGPKGPNHWHKIDGVKVGLNQSPVDFTDDHLLYRNTEFMPELHYRSRGIAGYDRKRASIIRGPSMNFERDLALPSAVGAGGGADACCEPASVALANRASSESVTGPLAVPVANTGHSIQINMPPSSDSKLAKYGGHCVFKGKNYHLKQIHFHSPAEHTVRRIALRMEAHLVHVSDDGNLLVIGMFIVPAELYKRKPIAFLDSLLTEEAFFFIPRTATDRSHFIGDLDLELVASLIQSNPSFYVYDGSLTTPPLTEGVQWIVGTAAFPIRTAVINAIESAMPRNNSRPAFDSRDYPRQEGISNTKVSTAEGAAGGKAAELDTIEE
ncbi:hypothetical protein HDU82_006884 [Entophlyctis luteolus]|nr:hypothetical protein HDU82_006884 [Entophlyctis luteolus]